MLRKPSSRSVAPHKLLPNLWARTWQTALAAGLARLLERRPTDFLAILHAPGADQVLPDLSQALIAALPLEQPPESDPLDDLGVAAAASGPQIVLHYGQLSEAGRVDAAFPRVANHISPPAAADRRAMPLPVLDRPSTPPPAPPAPRALTGRPSRSRVSAPSAPR